MGFSERPKPAYVGRDRPEARPSQRRDLVSPELRGVREAVEQYDRMSRAVVLNVKLYSVRTDGPALLA